MSKMHLWFWVCILGISASVPLHLKSVEHVGLQRRYGKDRGVKIGKIFGMLSGTLESIFLVGLWVSPQPSFRLPVFLDLTVSLSSLPFSITHLAISLPLIVAGAWFGIEGVKTTGMKVAETHCRPDKLQTTGVYSILRHPQYLGWILAHIGVSFLLSVLYSMLFTPILTSLIYVICRKEEDELILEYGKEYEDYRKRTPMLIPKLH